MQKNDFQEHILVCLSSSPSNGKIIETAAKMVKAFGGNFTALYVKTTHDAKMSDDDRQRLQNNIALAEGLGAAVTTVYGDDVSYQIAEFARLSRVTKIVIGRSSVKRRHFWSKPTLTEQLSAVAPDIDIHIIPDAAAETKYVRHKSEFTRKLLPNWKDILATVAVLAVATAIGYLFHVLKISEANIITVYILGVLLTSLFTQNYICNVVGAIASVIIFNILFVEPLFSLRVNKDAYVTFAIMFVASLITATLANRLQTNARQSARSAYRTKVLFDTNRLLQSEKNSRQVLCIAAKQIGNLMDRDVVAYHTSGGAATERQLFPSHGSQLSASDFADEDQITQWLFSGSYVGDNIVAYNGCKYYFVGMQGNIYGVLGIRDESGRLDSLENSIIQSVIGECALAIDNIRNAEEKESSALLAKQEQVRVNLLRTISHDLRTPLTSISGNADYLLNSGCDLDESVRKQIYTDIYDDSMWLVSLVENLLSVTRFENGKADIHLTCELAEDIIDETLRHVNRHAVNHNIRSQIDDKLLMARVDTRLILQVLANLIDNAIKYTPDGSDITVSAVRDGDFVRFSVADNGAGIPDELKEKVFEMFYTGNVALADSRRSMGLGLALCKTIVNAHGGEIAVVDNVPHGAVFTFTVPFGEVVINE